MENNINKKYLLQKIRELEIGGINEDSKHIPIPEDVLHDMKNFSEGWTRCLNEVKKIILSI